MWLGRLHASTAFCPVTFLPNLILGKLIKMVFIHLALTKLENEIWLFV